MASTAGNTPNIGKLIEEKNIRIKRSIENEMEALVSKKMDDALKSQNVETRISIACFKSGDYRLEALRQVIAGNAGKWAPFKKDEVVHGDMCNCAWTTCKHPGCTEVFLECK